MIVADTSVLLALLDPDDGWHQPTLDWYRGVNEALATTPLVLTEMDFLSARVGSTAHAAWRRDVAGGGYDIRWWDDAARQSCEIADGYRGLGVSLVDGSLVALAARLETDLIATLDQRHFRAMRPLDSHRAFRLLPADA